MKKWEKKEKRDSIDFGGNRQPGSGNQWARPGDVKTLQFLIDSKQTDKKSFSISHNMWDKISEEAALAYRIPMISLLLQDVELVVLSKDDFLAIQKGQL